MTIMPTQLGSNSIINNHKPQDYNKSEGDDQDDTCSSYKPSLEITKDCNSGSCHKHNSQLEDVTPTGVQTCCEGRTKC